MLILQEQLSVHAVVLTLSTYILVGNAMSAIIPCYLAIIKRHIEASITIYQNLQNTLFIILQKG